MPKPSPTIAFTPKETAFISQAKASGYELERLRTGAGDRYIIRGYRVNISQLIPNTWNFNAPTDRTKEAIGEALDELGQVVEIVARVHPTMDGFQIVDGEHRYHELRKLDEETASVNVIFGYTDAEIKRLTIILNETKGTPNDRQLGLLLGELSQSMPMTELMIGLPYDEMQMEGLLELALLDTMPLDELEPELELPSAKAPKDEGWTTITVKLPNDAMDVLGQARALVGDGLKLHENKAIAWGQVVEALAADYLSR